MQVCQVSASSSLRFLRRRILIIAKKMMGSKNEPGGTPEETEKELELVPLVTTDFLVFYYLKRL